MLQFRIYIIVYVSKVLLLLAASKLSEMQVVKKTRHNVQNDKKYFPFFKWEMVEVGQSGRKREKKAWMYSDRDRGRRQQNGKLKCVNWEFQYFIGMSSALI